MKIRLKKNCCVKSRPQLKGSIHEMTDKGAQSFIDAGYAEEVKEPKPKPKVQETASIAGGETATPPPPKKRGRPRKLVE